MGELVQAKNQTEIQRTDPIKAFLEPIRKRALVAAAKHIDKDSFYVAMYEALKRTPKLGDCDRESVYAALMTCAQLGLEPNGHPPQAYILPYGNKAQLILDYRGQMALAMRDPSIASIYAGTVRENDEFHLSLGDGARLEHRPNLTDGGDVMGYYAYLSYRDGRASRYVYMSHGEVEDHRDKYVRGKSGPWQTEFEAMAHKTAIKRLLNRMPLDPSAGKAIHLANRLDGQTVTMAGDEIVSVETHATSPPPVAQLTAPEAPDPRDELADKVRRLYESAKARKVKGVKAALGSIDEIEDMPIDTLQEVYDRLFELGSDHG